VEYLPPRGEITGQYVVKLVGEQQQTFHASVTNLNTKSKTLALINKQDQT
jgi:hypothetical protein